MNTYRCKHCGRSLKRKSDKAWVASFCEETGRDVHLMRVAKGGRRERSE